MDTMQYEVSTFWYFKRRVRKLSGFKMGDLRQALLTQTSLQFDPRAHCFHDVRVELGS